MTHALQDVCTSVHFVDDYNALGAFQYWKCALNIVEITYDLIHCGEEVLMIYREFAD